MLFDLESYLADNIEKKEEGDFLVFLDDKNNPTTDELYQRNVAKYYANNDKKVKLFYQDYEKDMIEDGLLFYPAFFFFNSRLDDLSYVQMLTTEELDEMDEK